MIGSGIGVPTTAALRARERELRVLVLERHFTVGGQTHEFRRKGRLEFDVGLHYVGGLENGGAKQIARVEQRIPGFADLVAYVDVATPVTIEHFQGNPRGEFYGLAGTPERVFQPWTRAATPVGGLYLTGADVMSPTWIAAD